MCLGESRAAKERGLAQGPTVRVRRVCVWGGGWCMCLNFPSEYVLCVYLVASVVSESLQPMDCSPPGYSVHGDSPGKNTGVGCHVLLLGIFPTQGLNPDLPQCRRILYRLSHQGSPFPSEYSIQKLNPSRQPATQIQRQSIICP